MRKSKIAKPIEKYELLYSWCIFLMVFFNVFSFILLGVYIASKAGLLMFSDHYLLFLLPYALIISLCVALKSWRRVAVFCYNNFSKLF